MAIYPELRGRVAIVTGVGRSGTIGWSIAESFARQGITVWCTDIDPEATRESAAAVTAAGSAAREARLDVTDEHAIAELVDEVVGRDGSVDILVNNAGGFQRLGDIGSITPSEWRKVLELNLTGSFLCAQAVVPHMARRSFGRIVNISSIVGHPPTVSAPVHYAASKAGLISLTQYLAREVGPMGITVNSVAPGTTATPRVVRLRGDEIDRDLVPRIPLRRIGAALDHAKAATFLVSDEASYITGATIDVNGGLGMS